MHRTWLNNARADVRSIVAALQGDASEREPETQAMSPDR